MTKNSFVAEVTFKEDILDTLNYLILSFFNFHFQIKMRICETAIFTALLVGSIKSKLTLVDLTHDFGNITTVYWPTEQQHRFKLLTLDRFDNGNSYYESNRFSTAEHGGTHMDAPRHFAKNKQGVNEIPLSNLVGLAYVADFTNESTNDANFQIEDKHLMAYEQKNGKIKDDSILLLYTGMFKLYLYTK